MAIFGRGQPPAWWPFNDPGRHDRFLAEVRRVVAERGARIEPTGEGIRMVGADGREQAVALENLAVICAGSSEHECPDLIARHLADAASSDELDALLVDPAALLDAVRVRLYPAGELDREADGAAPCRGIARDLLETVVVDTGGSVAMVTEDRFETLGLTEPELFGLGRANLHVHERLELHPRVVNDVELQVGESASFYTATWALLLDEALDLAEHGALVAVPNRHTLLAHPIVDGGAGSDPELDPPESFVAVVGGLTGP